MRALKSLADFKKLPGQRPKYLYKYRSLAPGNPRDFAEDIIRNNRLYHCLTEAFNDPFETVFYFEIPSAFSEYREYIYSWKRFSNLDDGDCEYLLSLKESGHPQGFSSFESELKRLLRQRTTVLSLCETYDNILMWSHYTDCHRGICIEFDLEVDKEYWGQVLPIQYRRRFPYIIKAEWSASEIVAIYLTKADFWAYEREWRFIKPLQHGIHVFIRYVGAKEYS